MELKLGRLETIALVDSKPEESTVECSVDELLVDSKSTMTTLLDPEVLPIKERAEAVLVLLEECLSAQEAHLMQLARARDAKYGTNNFSEYITEARDADLQNIRRDKFMESGWAYDYVAALVERRPIALWLNDGAITTGMLKGAFLDEDALASYEIAKMLHNIDPSNETRLHFVIDTGPQVKADTGEDDFTVVDERVDVVEAFLAQDGMLPERAVDIHRLADYSAAGLEIIERLNRPGVGEIVTDFHPGQIVLKPEGWLLEWSGLQNGSVGGREAMQLGPIPRAYGENEKRLRYGAVLNAAPIVQEASPETLQMAIGFQNISGAIGTILRGLGVIRRNNYHGLYDSRRRSDFKLGSELPAFRIGRILRRELQQYVESLSRYQTFDDLDTENYAQINYGVLRGQDKDIIRTQIASEPAVMKQLGIDPTRPETLLGDFESAHVCIGGNMDPVMLRQRLSRGKILGVDIAPSARDYAEKIKQGLHAELWGEHEDEMVLAAGKLGRDATVYEKSLINAANKLHVVVASAHDLPKDAFRLVQMHFGAEATGLTRANFYSMLRSIEGSLKDDGVFEAVFTVNSSKAWPDGQHQLPATTMTENDYDLALIDSGFEILERKLIGEHLSEEDKLRSGEDFIYRRCRLRPGARL